MKVCTKCNIKKEADQFYKSKIVKDGLNSYCKICSREVNRKYKQSNKVEIRIVYKKWRGNNKERVTTLHKNHMKILTPGVYMIKNIMNGKRYVGQSTQPNRRKYEHMYIRKKKIGCTNEWLQEDLKQYGRQAFIFGILEHCTEEDLLAKEEHYIRTLQPEYNKLLL